MNKFCVNLIKQSIVSNVFRGNQRVILSRAEFCSGPPSDQNKVPLSQNPKHKTSPQVTLITGDKIEITTLDQAKKIADRRSLKLVNVVDFDTKSKRAVYKLMTGAEYLAEDLKNREQKKLAKNELHIKPEKLLSLTSKISTHDLESKLSKCAKWLEKLHEVRVVITGDSSDKKSEEILKVIEERMVKVQGRIVQKRAKNGLIKFSILPTINKKEQSEKPPLQNVKSEEKKILEPKSPIAQQVKSFHTLAF